MVEKGNGYRFSISSSRTAFQIVRPLGAFTAVTMRLPCAVGYYDEAQPRKSQGNPKDSAATMRIAFGRFTFDNDTRELLQEGRRVHVSPKAFDLLRVLLERRPNVVSKNELHEKVWPGAFVGDANLSVVIAEIRQVLGDDSKDGRFIRTVHRVGYAFSGAVMDAPGDAAGVTTSGYRC